MRGHVYDGALPYVWRVYGHGNGLAYRHACGHVYRHVYRHVYGHESGRVQGHVCRHEYRV